MSYSKIALVTGANKGIGKSVVRELSRKGCHVILGCRNEVKGLGTVSELRDEGLSVELALLDVSSEESIKKML